MSEILNDDITLETMIAEKITPQKLRDVAWTIDMLSHLTVILFGPIAHMDDINAETFEITAKVSKSDGSPISVEEARTLMEWLDGDEMQNDIRQLADDLEEFSKTVEDEYWEDPDREFCPFCEEDTVRDMNGICVVCGSFS